MLTALGPLSMDMYLPSLPDIAHVLEAPTARVQLTVSSYLIGFAVGQMIYGPLSDRLRPPPGAVRGARVFTSPARSSARRRNPSTR